MTQTQTHTPQQWHAGQHRYTNGIEDRDGDRGHVTPIDDADGHHIAEVFEFHYGNDLPWEANAELIALAPETAAERDRLLAVNAAMLEAMQEIVKDWDNGLIVGKDGNAEYHLGRLGVVAAAATGGTS